jgi:hypothetical protein
MESTVLMRSALLLSFLFALTLTAANLKLYTTDGEYQIVREYSVMGDRVRFYSVDRSDWEEVPSSMIDLKRTAAEASTQQEAVDKVTKQFDEEAAAEKAEREELAKIPQDSGVYRIEDGKLRTFKVADITIRTKKGNTLLRVLSPLPIIEGISTVELAGEHSANLVHEERPEFYFQLDKEESFAIVKVGAKKNVRVVETVETLPISKEYVETRDLVKTFSKQLPGDNFYKIWPQEALPAGEYALVEYVEQQVDLRVWDFRIE